MTLGQLVDLPQAWSAGCCPTLFGALDGMTNHGLELFRCAFAWVGEVDLVMQAGIGKVEGIALLCRKFMHVVYGCRLAVVGSGMHALHAQTLVNLKQLDCGKVQLLFGRGFRDGPVKVGLGDKIGQADARDEVEVVLAHIIDVAAGRVLPPEALERRHHKVEIAFDTPRAFLRHLDGVGDTVKQWQGVLILAAFGVWIALSARRDIAHGRDGYDARLAGRSIELFAFLLEVVRHGGHLSADEPVGANIIS